MEGTLWMTLLLDVYGGLLTQRQREALSLHIEEDLSYAEIAQSLGVSRQAAADAAGTAREQLKMYEAKLQFLAQQQMQQKILAQALLLLQDRDDTQEIRALLAPLIEGEEHGF